MHISFPKVPFAAKAVRDTKAAKKKSCGETGGQGGHPERSKVRSGMCVAWF